MGPTNRMIVDTDPGVDDVLALLLACCAKPEETELLLLSVTFGNVGIYDCLRNVVTLFHMIGKEQEWRRENGMPEGFDTLKTFKPLVAVGAKQPLQDQLMMADFFHGRDGLGGIHTSHPHFTPSEAWKQLFELSSGTLANPAPSNSSQIAPTERENALFIPSNVPAHKEILRLLRENPKDSITIVAIGPLTNLALAAAEDPETFLKARKVVVMGGAIGVPGNITPLAEFNTHADAVAAARVFALTSPNPITTMPPTPPAPPLTGQLNKPPPPFLGSYPSNLSRRLNLILLPLDVTTTHDLLESDFNKMARPLTRQGSPLAAWMSAFLPPTFRKTGKLSMHDPLAVYYAMTSDAPFSSSPYLHERDNLWDLHHGVDVRIETAGQWTRGACITDLRGLATRAVDPHVDLMAHISGDAGGWMSENRGNRVAVVVESPVPEVGQFGDLMCRKIFGLA